MTEISTTVEDNSEDTAPQPGAGVIDEPSEATEEKQTLNEDHLDESEKSTDTSTDEDTKSDPANKDDAATDTPAKFDDDLDSWIEKRGTPKPTTDEERQAYQDIRDEQREFTRTQQAKKEADNIKEVIDEAKPKIEDLEDDDEEDPLEKRIRTLEEEKRNAETTRLQSEFLTQGNEGKPVTEEQWSTVLDIMKEKFARPTTEAAKLTAFYQWSSPDALPDLLELAKARLGSTVDSEAEKEAARKEEREEIARASQANSTPRGAKSTVTTEKSAEAERLERFSKW